MNRGEEAARLRAEAERIAQSREFARSRVMRRLLSFLIEETIAGRGETLKAYTIAVEGLGRPSDFDAQSDSYPRVQIGRLRRMLKLFYDRNPAPGGYRLSIPVGAYRVSLIPTDMDAALPDPPMVAPTDDTDTQTALADLPTSSDDDAPSPAAPRRRHATLWLIALAGLILILILLLIPRLWHGPPGKGALDNGLVPPPPLIVTPTRVPSPALRVRGRTIDVALGDALYRSWMVDVRDGDQKDDLASDSVGYRLDSELTGPAGAELVLTLWAMPGERRVWTDHIPVGNSSADVAEALAGPVSTLVRDTGVIAVQERARFKDSLAPGLPCLLAYRTYWRQKERSMRVPVVRCVDRTIALAPNDPNALAAASFLRKDAMRFEPQAAKRLQQESGQLADRAVAADPFSADAHLARARAAFDEGSCARGKASGRRAVALAPADPVPHALLGLYLFSCGDPDFAGELQRARALEPDLPAIALTPLVIAEARRGQGAAAFAIVSGAPAQVGDAEPLHDLGMAVAYAAKDDIGTARDYWDKLRATGQPGDSADQLLARHMPSRRLRQFHLAFLEERGVIPAQEQAPAPARINRAAAR